MKKVTFAAMLPVLVCIGCDSRQAEKSDELANVIEVPAARRLSRADELAHMDMHFDRFRTALAEASATPPSARPQELARLQGIRKVIAALPVEDACLAAANKIRVEMMSMAIDSLLAYFAGDESASDEAMLGAGKAVTKADEAVGKCV